MRAYEQVKGNKVQMGLLITLIWFLTILLNPWLTLCHVGYIFYR